MFYLLVFHPDSTPTKTLSPRYPWRPTHEFRPATRSTLTFSRPRQEAQVTIASCCFHSCPDLVLSFKMFN